MSGRGTRTTHLAQLPVRRPVVQLSETSTAALSGGVEYGTDSRRSFHFKVEHVRTLGLGVTLQIAMAARHEGANEGVLVRSLRQKGLHIGRLRDRFAAMAWPSSITVSQLPKLIGATATS